MRKKGLIAVMFFMIGVSMYGEVHTTLYITEDTKPLRIIDFIKDGGKDLVSTDLDTVDNLELPDMPIASTLDSVRVKLSTYLQWIAGTALVVAVLLLIYNGMMLMLSPLSADQSAAVKKRIRYILIGALLVTGFYFVLRIILSITLQILNN